MRTLPLKLFWGFLILTGWGRTDEPIPLRLRALSIERDIKGLHLSTTEGYKPFSMIAFRPGEYMDVENPSRVLSFFIARPPSDPESEEEVNWIKVAETRLTEEAPSYTLLFARRGSPGPDGLPLQVMPLPDHSREYIQGSVRFFNISPFPAAVELGEQIYRIQPGETRTITPTLSERDRAYMHIASQQNGEWTVFARGPLTLTRNRRATVVIAYSSLLQEALQIDSGRREDGTAIPAIGISVWRDDPIPSEPTP